MRKVFKYTLVDLARNRFVLAFAFLLFLMAEGLFQLEDDPIKALLSLVQIVLALVPLIALIFTIVYTYDTQEFTQLLAVQPIGRPAILSGRMLALAAALVVAQVFGLGLPLLVHAPGLPALLLFVNGTVLAVVFMALGTLISLKQRDKARGVGIGLGVWFLFVLVYDALLMAFMFAFSDRPIEPFVVPLAALNPIDLARISVMLRVDLAAMMGYSGAVYKDLFGSTIGILIAMAVMALWIVWPTAWAFRSFRRKDL
ncbi:MAG: ABC transporter permease subunit [Flavobacteriales bacterium]|nr:ABC transporter permease subunit [Flavobacteriales bacterium]MBK9287059.1 ABC transporter permease subunit [Flavobacteriales bacterium]